MVSYQLRTCSGLYMFWTVRLPAVVYIGPVQPTICEEDRNGADTLEWQLGFWPGRYRNQLLIKSAFPVETWMWLAARHQPRIIHSVIQVSLSFSPRYVLGWLLDLK